MSLPTKTVEDPLTTAAAPASVSPAARIATVGFGMLYALLVVLTYNSLLITRFEYWGLGPLHPSFEVGVVAWALALLPLPLLPVALRRPSAVFVWLIYLLLYVPAELLAPAVTDPTLGSRELLQLSGVTAVGMFLIVGASLLPHRTFQRRRLSLRGATRLATALTVALLGYFLLHEGGHVSFSRSLTEIYDARADLIERTALGGSALVLYAQLWLAGFCFPVLSSLFWQRKQRIRCGISALGPVVLFAVNGLKGMLLSPVLFAGLLVASFRNGKWFGPTLAAGLSALLALGWVAETLFPENGFWYTAVLHFRLIAVPSELYVQYFDFFRDHPLTYLSHVSGFSTLIHYPYDAPLPEVIGNFYYGVEQDGANATSWAMDGLASFGLYGVVLSSLMIGGVLFVLDWLAEGADPRIVGLACGYVTIILLASSLFTTLLSGGLLLLLVSLVWWPAAGSTSEPAAPGSAT